MQKLTVGLLIFITGWGLGWYSRTHWDTDPVQLELPVVPAPSIPVYPEEAATAHKSAAPADMDNIVSLLQRSEFSAVLERYDSLQAQAAC